jgi:hypothetical protein
LRGSLMTFKLRLKIDGLTLNDLEVRRIQRHLRRLDDRLTTWADPHVTVSIVPRPAPPGVTVRIRVQSGHLGDHLIGSESSDTADQAVHGALAQILRQLERQHATVPDVRRVANRRTTQAPMGSPATLTVAAEPEDT